MKLIEINDWLVKEVQSLDISQTHYRIAVERYKAVGDYIEKYLLDKYEIEVKIYPQGSFAIGTVVKPYDNREGYDIDLVCEIMINKNNVTPDKIKSMVYEAIASNETYREMLDDEGEGRRCWTINYSEQSGLTFHMDILPSVSNDLRNYDDTIIYTTTKRDTQQYEWDKTDPLGFVNWFNNVINKVSFEKIYLDYKTKLFESREIIYASIQDVPNELVRTKLQRTIQMLKRHRDITFDSHELKDYKPMSMIITILASKVYIDLDYNNMDLIDVINEISYELNKYCILYDNNYSGLQLPLIKKDNNQWVINNPVIDDENLAERWNEDGGKRAKAFFHWIKELRLDMDKLLSQDMNIYENGENARFTTVVKKIRSMESRKLQSIDKVVQTSINIPLKPWD